MASPGYAITFARSARKEVERLDPALVNRIFPLIESLAQNPRPSGCKELSGVQSLWRIRVGHCRVVYHIYDAQRLIDIVAVRHRREAYR